MFIKKITMLAAAVACAAAGSAFAAYPEKPIAVVVPFAAGGPTDVVARSLAQVLGTQLKGSVIVENVGGAGGTIGAGKVARAPGDGYTLLFHHIGMSTAPSLYRKLDFKPLEDFIPIGAVVDVPMTLIAKPQMAQGNLKDLLAYVRANKDKINLANAGVGAASQLCGLLLQQRTQCANGSASRGIILDVDLQDLRKVCLGGKAECHGAAGVIGRTNKGGG